MFFTVYLSACSPLVVLTQPLTAARAVYACGEKQPRLSGPLLSQSNIISSPPEHGGDEGGLVQAGMADLPYSPVSSM